MDLEQAQQDYALIADLITWARTHYREQPGLSEMAAAAGSSELCLQQLFSRWAGVSPLHFLRYLTPEYMRTVMRDSASLLSPSPESGLAESGHQHLRRVKLETFSPGEFKHQTRGWLIEFGQIATPFGPAVIGFTARGVCHLSFLEKGGQAEERVRSAWPGARLREDAGAAQALGERIFPLADTRSPRSVSAWVVGSDFQLQIWRALLTLPSGYLWSYGELARRAGRPGAARAAGTAMANNPLACLIPCHRVLRQSGEVGGYHWGEDRKAAMVAWETARRFGTG